MYPDIFPRSLSGYLSLSLSISLYLSLSLSLYVYLDLAIAIAIGYSCISLSLSLSRSISRVSLVPRRLMHLCLRFLGVACVLALQMGCVFLSDRQA